MFPLAGGAAGAAAAGRTGGGDGVGGVSTSVPGLGGLASEPGAAAPPGKKGAPVISGSNASGRSPGRESHQRYQALRRALSNASLL